MTTRICPLPLVALRGDETCPRCGCPAREHRGHPAYVELAVIVGVDFATEPDQTVRQYFFLSDNCPVNDATDPRCICWRDEGTGPLKDYPGRVTWRTVRKPQPQEKTMTETTEPTREQIEACMSGDWPTMLRHREDTRLFRTICAMALRTLDAEVHLAAMTEQSESYKAIALSAARRVRDIHAIVCGEDDSLSPREHHEAIVDVLCGHHALGPWTAAEADLARKIASDPCVVSKRWPGGGVEPARIVGEEAERAERSHRTLCGDSAQFLMRKAIPWIAAMTERAEKAEAQLAERDRYIAEQRAITEPSVQDLARQLREATERAELAEASLGAANAAVDALRMTVSILETDARAIRDAAMTHAGDFMRGGETAAPAIERMATALREATERAEKAEELAKDRLQGARDASRDAALLAHRMQLLEEVDLRTAKRERDEAIAKLAEVQKDAENLLWNLAGCDTIASSGTPTTFDASMARPALHAVNQMATRLADVERKLAEAIDRVEKAERDRDDARLGWIDDSCLATPDAQVEIADMQSIVDALRTAERERDALRISEFDAKARTKNAMRALDEVADDVAAQHAKRIGELRQEIANLKECVREADERVDLACEQVHRCNETSLRDSYTISDLRAKLADTERRLVNTERERDAYKQAKAANDSWFMRERNKDHAYIADLERKVAELPIERLDAAKEVR